MIVSHKHRFIFLKTAKTAGTSVEIALSEFLGPDDIVTPISAVDEAKRHGLGYPGPQNCAVPFQRFRRIDWKRFVTKGKRPEFFNHMPAALIRRYVGPQVWRDYFKFCFERNSYDKALSRYFWRTRDDAERRSMAAFFQSTPHSRISDWWLYTIDDEVAVDFVGRYEHLEEDLETVRRRIGLPHPIELPRAKGGHRPNRRPPSEVLTPEERALVEDHYAREIAAFGYTLDGTPGDALPMERAAPAAR